MSHPIISRSWLSRDRYAFATIVAPPAFVISKAARSDDWENTVLIDPTNPGSSRNRAAAISTSDITGETRRGKATTG